MQIDLSRFRDTFFQEAEEHLAEMETGLLRLEHESDPDLLNAIFRGAHSIKGASGTFGFEDILRFTHAMEGLLDRMRSGAVPPCGARVNLLLEAVDVLRRLVDAARSGSPAPEEAGPTADSLLIAQRAGVFPPDGPMQVRTQDAGGVLYRVRFRPSADLFRQGLDPALIIRDLGRIGELVDTALDSSHLPALEDLDPETCFLAWNIRLKADATEQDIRDVFAFVEDGAEIEVERESTATVAVEQKGVERSAVKAPPSVRHVEGSSMRVATAKVDKLIDLVGELVIAESMAAQILAAFQASDLVRLQEAFGEMERYTRELQERIMGIRMLPVGSVFSRFPRVVRDLAVPWAKRSPSTCKVKRRNSIRAWSKG